MRKLLATVLTAALVAGVAVVATTSPASSEVDASVVCSGTTNNARVMQKEMDDLAARGGGTYRLPGCTFGVGGVVTVPGTVSVLGEGGRGTEFYALSSDMSLQFAKVGQEREGGYSGRFTIFARNLATTPLVVRTVQHVFVDIEVRGAATTGVFLDSAQNNTFLSTQVNGFDEQFTNNGIIVDRGSSGNAFVRPHISNVADFGVVVQQSASNTDTAATPEPFDNSFYRLHVERGSPIAQVVQSAGGNTQLLHPFLGGSAGATTASVWVTDGNLQVLGGTIQKNGTRAGTAVRADNTGTLIDLTGRTLVNNWDIGLDTNGGRIYTDARLLVNSNSFGSASNRIPVEVSG